MSRVFSWMWGISIFLVPTRGLRLAYAATVGAYTGTSCREVCLRCLHACGFAKKMPTRLQSGQLFPTCQVRVARFCVCVCVSSPPPPLLLLLVLLVPNCDDVSSVSLAGPQPRSCLHSVPCLTSTAIVWVQRSVPDLNRSCELSVPREMLVEGEVFIEKLHGGKGTYVAITKFAYISPTATPTRAYAKNRLQFCFFSNLQMSGRKQGKTSWETSWRNECNNITRKQLRVESPIFWKKLGLISNKTYQAYAPETLVLGLCSLHLWQVSCEIRLPVFAYGLPTST